MATETTANGVVKSGSNAIAEVTGFTLNTTSDTTEDTTIGDTWRTHKATLKSYTMSIDCFWDQTDTTGQGSFDAGEEVTFSLYPSGETSSNVYYTGTGIITSKSLSGSVGEMITATLELQGTGALTESTVA